MPKIDFEAAGFPTAVPLSGAVSANEAELLHAAIRMGDVSMFGGPGRPLIELLWRFAMIRSALDISQDRWQKSASYVRLDASEKRSVSYFLGMVQASLMARSLLGATDVAHVDAVLQLQGKLTRRSRPDLVGYRGTPSSANVLGRLLIEAKGRTGDFAPGPINTAKVQLMSAPAAVLGLVGPHHIAVASLGYFARDTTWSSYLVDPPPVRGQRQEVSEAPFRGLVSLASLRPIASTIANLQRVDDRRVERDDSTEMIEAVLPDVGVTIGMPIDVYDEVIELAPLGEVVTADRAAVWAERSTDRRALVEDRRPEVADRHGGREFLFDNDGVLIELTPRRSDGT